MCIISYTYLASRCHLGGPKFSCGGMPPNPPKRACFRTLTSHPGHHSRLLGGGNVQRFESGTQAINPDYSLGGGSVQRFESGTQTPPKRACFRTLTLHTLCSTVYIALPVLEQLPYSGYALASVSESSKMCVIVYV